MTRFKLITWTIFLIGLVGFFIAAYHSSLAAAFVSDVVLAFAASFLHAIYADERIQSDPEN